eukprot:TRINITY_DN73067_c0_g1_i1.p1 TRINITY_DN73067_c0_g1~~TRINITY_DN73067_c0_g1_i1.p1  ORF type:complete len:748 (-),score=143.59 TRINITY_DN73067_c0_g1_i1:94-2337(-)
MAREGDAQDQAIRRRPGNSSAVAVLLALALGLRSAWICAPEHGTAALGLTSSSLATASKQNTTDARGALLLPIELELWHKRIRRRKLIQILNQAAETRRYSSTARNLERQGPDGSHLVSNGGDDESAEDSSRAPAPGDPPPPELQQLLELEDRIRRLRHMRRILRARSSAVKSARKLALLRQHPIRRAGRRLSQVAGYAYLARAALYTAVRLIPAPSPQPAAKETHSQHALKDINGGLNVPSRVWEMAQPAFDYLLQAFAIRALRRGLSPRVKGPEVHIPDVALEDVAGIGAAKVEALEIVECLMAPARFASVGAKCPKGLLLTGPPGCGKTLLAKAIASTAAVPFISRSGADFNGRFAGTGTNLVKELFRIARTVAPAVVLIDELDYIGRRRGEERGGGLETDRSAALTQLLAEMDGFASTEGVVVIGTTNRPDILDKALTRPGRFDRKVTVPLPDVSGRLKILNAHAQRLAIEHPGQRKLTGPESSSAPNWKRWAHRTPGFSGADLAGLVNEAAMAAAREGALGVGDRHVQLAYSKSLIGVPSGRRPSPAEMELTAWHEAGHAVVNEVMRATLGKEGKNGFQTVAHISIVPAGGTGGVTQFTIPDESKRMPQTRSVLLADLAVSMGGRAAEELLKGPGEATMGAQSDIDQATRMATEMVTIGGLSDAIGPRSLTAGIEPSPDLRRQADIEVNKLLRAALAAAREALRKNQQLHLAVSKVLLEKETMEGESFRMLVENHTLQLVKL